MTLGHRLRCSAGPWGIRRATLQSPSRPAPRRCLHRRVRRGFSLAELLTVIAIIALVVAITIPALSGARDVAKRVESQRLATDIAVACETFGADQRGRAPGWFSGEAMGSAYNASTAGLTAMENALLELALDTQTQIRSQSEDGFTLELDPDGGGGEDPIYINPSLIGTEDGYLPAGPFLRPIAGQSGDQGTDVPDVIDPFGMPVLLWVQAVTGDRRATAAVPDDAPDGSALVFANEEFSDSDNPALFYWASNAGYLNAESLGERQTDVLNESLLGGGRDADDRLHTMAAFLGSLNSPNVLDTTTNAEDMYPTRPRGSSIVQAAGVDQNYLANDGESLGKAGVPAGTTRVYYGYSFKPSGSSELYQGADGEDELIPVIDAFDDLFVGG